MDVTHCSVMSCTTSKSVTLPSSLLRTHAPILNPLSEFVFLIQKVFAGCCQSLLGVGLSRRYLYETFPTCLDPYPGRILRCIFPISSLKTSVSPTLAPGRLPQLISVQNGFKYGACFEAAVIPLCLSSQVCSPL